MNFRLDINALRAIAVSSVVLYHFNSSLLPGGFAGVDVFFVISGFLMTRIIFTRYSENRFSFGEFYISRAKRIIPALSVMLLVTLVAGFFTLSPFEFKTLGKHTLKSALFISNHAYLKEAGYFDTSSMDKWLLHTWSLSVEWQFYLIYPLVIVGLLKTFKYETVKNSVLFIFLVSFIYSIYTAYNSPDSAYYLLSSRAWEMLLGGIAYLYPIKLKRTFAQLVTTALGMLLIVVSCLFIDSSFAWPSQYTLPVTIGAYFVLSTNYQHVSFYNNLIIKQIGKSSYSIYLWHWPILVLGSYWQIPHWEVVGLLLSIAIGIFSTKYIESLSFQAPKISVLQLVKYPPIALTAITLLLSQLVYSTNGALSLYPLNIQTISNEATNLNPERERCHVGTGKVPECVYGEGRINQIVLGDSHAASIIRSIDKAFPNSATLDWTMSGCRTAFGIYNIREVKEDHSCGEFIDSRIAALKNYPSASVYILNRYASLLYGANEYQDNDVTEFFVGKSRINRRGKEYTEQALSSMYETICAISKVNKVYVIDPIPELRKHVPKTMAKEIMRGNSDYRVSISVDEYTSRNKEIFALFNQLETDCDVHRVQVKQLFCDQDSCYGDIKGRPLYFDDDHLSEYGSELLIPMIQRMKKVNF